MRIEPAELAFDSAGTPYAPAYGDVYHSADSGPGQAQHVFVDGNELPRRWAGKRSFTVVETGFGLGLNFLATWRAWRADPARCERLHFVSLESHPFTQDALRVLHRRYAEFAPFAESLQEAWPPLVSGLHRLHFEGERLTLTLALGDARDLIPSLRLHADAIYLDGFAPRCNPEMWSAQLLRGLARFCLPGTTVATYSSAGSVREGLEAAGFILEKCPGFGRKRDMLRGRYLPRWQPRHGFAAVPAPTQRHAIVIGAGIAGAAICERLVARGWRIELIERRAPLPAVPPVRYAGVFHPHVSRDDCVLSRAARNGFLYAVSRWRALESAGQPFAWSRCGVLQPAGDDNRARRLVEAIAALAYPANYAQYLERGEAEALAGCRLSGGGAWFPGAGWMRPASLVAAQLDAAGSALTAHFGTAVHAIAPGGGVWQALAADGSLIAAAPVLILANSNDMTRLASVAQPMGQIRGQVSYVPAAALAAPRVVLTGSGYVLPAADGIVVAGSTYDRDDDDPALQRRGHEANLQRLAQLLPEARLALDTSALDGAVGFRCVAPDRMPLVGAMPDADAARAQQVALCGAQFADLPRIAGLYCASGYASRGLVWAALAAELLASLIEGEPLPVEGELADALDPGRFALKRLRRGSL